MITYGKLFLRVALTAFAGLLAAPAAAAGHTVAISDGCSGLPGCIGPNPLTIHAGDAVSFLIYCEPFDYPCSVPGTQPHNIVADDGSFRCARGCDDDGGDGTPAVNTVEWGFERNFKVPGLVRYHDEASGASGLIIVLGGPGPLVVEYFNPERGTYFITSDSGEQALVDAGGAGDWQRTGQAFKSGGPDRVCRFIGNPFLNPVTKRPIGPNSHFYTADVHECTSLKRAFDARVPSWKFESDDFSILRAGDNGCPSNTTSIYRAYNNGFARGVDSNHRFATDVAIYQSMIAAGWTGEGVVMCAPQ